MKEGDLVGYVSVVGDKTFQHCGRVRELWPEGIPSVREPMLKIEGKAGVVLESHCQPIDENTYRTWVGDQQRSVAG